jgi:hypothetical protein
VQPLPPPPAAKLQPLTATLSSASTQPASDGGPTLALPRVQPPAPAAAKPAIKPPAAPPGPAAGSTSSSGSFSGAPKPAAPQKPQTSGGAPLKGVHFVLSGFVNPERAELRDKVPWRQALFWHAHTNLQAVKLGAVYHPNWEPGCTHLVAQFAKTPKAAEAHSMLTLA